jgi:hypothetical protein
VLPVFGDTEVRKLTKDLIEDWWNAGDTAPKRKRTARGDKQALDPALGPVFSWAQGMYFCGSARIEK